MNRTIPPLDAEIEEVDRETAYETVKEGLGDQGICLRYFRGGYGEWKEYYIENPSGDGLLFWRDGTVEQRPVRGDLLSSIGRFQGLADDFLREMTLIPRERLPKWGDGSAHYHCEKCSFAVVKSERVLNKDGCYHAQCLEKSRKES